MKVAPVLAAALVIWIAIPGSNQGKPKFCKGADGNLYKKGEGYEDKEACLRYTCVKGRNKLKMKKEKIEPCPEPNLATNVTALETEFQALQESVQSMQAMISTIQSTSSQLETKIASNMDAIITNKVTISNNNAALAAKDAQIENCFADISSSDCPSPANGKTSVAGGISSNTAALDDIQEAIAEHQQPKFNLVVSGGDLPNTKKSSEVISSENVCSQRIPPLPMAFQQLSTSIFFNNSIWICGGYEAAYSSKKCQILKVGASQWTFGPYMKVPRHCHTIIKAGDELIAMGGWRSINSMEKYSLASGEWTIMSETMPNARYDHCTVYFPNTKTVVLMGGLGWTKNTDSFDVVSGQWTQLNPLPLELRNHRCITMGQSILVAGGWAIGNILQKNVYRLNMINGKPWETFGELTTAKSYFTMGFVDNKLMIAGGQGKDGRLATIDIMEKNGVWKESKLKLSVPRSVHGGTMVPAEAFPCH